jgi:hypothetical protein
MRDKGRAAAQKRDNRTMKLKLRQMVDEVLLRAGRPLTVRELIGAIREMFAENPKRAELRRACFEEPRSSAADLVSTTWTGT